MPFTRGTAALCMFTDHQSVTSTPIHHWIHDFVSESVQAVAKRTPARARSAHRRCCQDTFHRSRSTGMVTLRPLTFETLPPLRRLASLSYGLAWGQRVSPVVANAQPESHYGKMHNQLDGDDTTIINMFTSLILTVTPMSIVSD